MSVTFVCTYMSHFINNSSVCCNMNSVLVLHSVSSVLMFIGSMVKSSLLTVTSTVLSQSETWALSLTCSLSIVY